MASTGGNPKTAVPVAIPGGFISQPDVFPDAPQALQHVLKMVYRPTVREGVAALEFSTDAIIVDYSVVDAKALDPQTLSADCDFLKAIALKYPAQLRQLLEEMQRGTTAGIERADKIATEIGLTEGGAVKSGGGLLFLVVLAVAAVGAAGCGGALKQKATSPAATTTPK